MTSDLIQECAQVLYEAELRRRPVAPLTDRYPEMDAASAYAIQGAGITMKLRNRDIRVVGRKAGLTNPAVQRVFGVNEPDFGHILSDMVVAGSSVIRRDCLIQPRVEPEIAFVLSADLRGPHVSPADVWRATGFICPALEIIDSRIQDWQIRLADTVADNASASRVIVGSRIPVRENLDLRPQEAVLTVNGKMVSAGFGEAVLGDPAMAVAWLANCLSGFGDFLRAGEIIMPGAFSSPAAIQAGDTVDAVFPGLGDVGFLVQ